MAIKAKPSFSLKDQLFNASTVGRLADHVKAAWARFRRDQFVASVLAGFPERELKDRITWMAANLEAYLPNTHARAREILLAALPEPLDPTRTDDDFGEFIWAVPAEFVAAYGCSEQHLDESLAFLHAATMRFSCENAIRPFLNQFPAATMAFVHRATHDRNYHVRRLASEGIRPLLPWAPRISIALPDIIAVLDELHADPTRYVTRSVANNLNDISKLEPNLVYAALSRWRDQHRQAPSELAWMTRHALRTLKKSHAPEALRFLGYSQRPKVVVRRQTAPRRIAVGETLDWSAQLQSEARQTLAMTLEVDFLKANGRHSAKVFSLADGNYARGEAISLSKRIAFRPMTTRTLYPGEHRVRLMVNGKPFDELQFELVESR
ncbi:MAG: DNA alkylation repair protein [Pseudomonadota bacterium]